MQKPFSIGNPLFRSLVRGLSALAIFLLPFAGNAAGKFYHYTPDGKTFFELSDQKILVKFSSQISFEKQARILSGEPLLRPLTKEMVMPAPKVVLAELKKGTPEKEILALIDRLQALPETEYANPFLVYSDGTLEAAQDIVAVKLRDRGDFSTMEEMVKRNRAIIKEQYKYDPLLFFIQVNKQSSAKALELANQFAESGKFATSEPDMLKLLKPFYVPNDTYYNYQWSINNTGSSIQYSGTAGADMKVQTAWEISRGSSSIKVAIIDEGVDLNHADLLANMLPGFDGTGLGSNGGPSGNDAHGTNCAGIVAAVGNNNLGTAGIAHLCKIIPVRIAYSNTAGNWVTTNAQIGTSIDWAWNQGGADVLSNSWGGGSSSTLINDPITRATTQGRGGLGAPVLFAAGNANGANTYPATLTNVISVIAMSMCNQRKSTTSCDGETWWGSNYGTGADVAAPGVKIYSTDISGSAGYNTAAGVAGDYFATFNGTSSATPNTSGVMALILSVNPSLTMTQARQILESSCDKVGGYTYNSGVSGQPNGTWSNDLGYGRVNALTALQAANPQPCTTPTVGGTASGPSNFAAGANVTFTLAGHNGTDIQWQSSTDAGTSWSDIGGANSAISTFTLNPGTYLVRAAVTRINCSPSYSNSLSVTVTSPVGDVFTNPIITTLPYSTSISNGSGSGYTNAYTGTNNQISADIFFRFTTGPCTDSIRISTCGTAFDNYIHLLNSAGTWIVSNDDNGPLCTGTAASLKQLVLPNTTYYVVVEGYSTNTGTINLSISQIDNPVFTTSITAGGPTTFCSGGSVTLTAAAAASYLWSTGATTQSISAGATGSYSVTVTNSNGCSASASKSVTVNPLPNVTASSLTTCLGTPVTLTGSPAGGTFSLPNPYSGPNSQYIYTYTDGNGCAASAVGTVAVNPLPNVTVANLTTCEGTPVTLTGSPAGGTFSLPNPYSGPNSQYIYTYTDANGCTNSNVGTVEVNPLPTVFNTSGGGSYCNLPGGGATVNLSGSEIGVNYEFKFTATGTFATVAGTGSPLSVNNVTGAGTVYVVATNASTGCSRNMNFSASVFPQTPSTWYQDFDGDGYGNPGISTQACSQPIGYVANSTDCNDANNLANPGATEICGNGIDDNCNGSTDEDCVLYTFYKDSDGDTYGTTAFTVTSNNPTVPSGYVTNSLDCNDGDPAVNPDAIEICNGIDDNCDGTIDNGTPALASVTAIAGPGGVCRNSTGQVFSVDPIPGATSYIWTLPAGASGSSTSNSITLSFSSTYVTGNICVKAANSCVQGANFCRSVTYYSAKPGTPVAIIGSTPGVCGDARTYSVANVANATSYNWTAPANSTIVSGQGTNTVSVQFLAGFTTGSLSVTASNCVGASTARTLALSYATGTPASIAGNLYGNCAGSTGTYSCPAVSGATVYTWTVPANAVINSGQGTNSISVTFPNPFTSGAITVKSGTACYTSAAKSVTVYSVPVAPSSITGTLVSVCGGTTQTYSCPASTTGATSYSWTVPAGSVINSGQGTNSISLTLPAVYSSGTISVVAVNACGNSALRSVTVRAVPVAPTSITGLLNGACGGSTQTYSCAASTTGATSYTWALPAGSVINSGQGTNSINVTLPAVYTSGSISVFASNGCGNSTTYSTTVRSLPSTPGTIGGQATNLCGGGTFTYTISAVAGATGYTWTPAAGCSIVTNLGNSVTMSVPSGFTTGTLSVIASNACGNSPARTLALTRLPSTPGTITGPSAVCPLQSGLAYTVPATAGLTYTWTMPGTGSIQSGQGTNAISATWGSAAGSVVVKANNACGSSGNKTLAVALNACRPALDQDLTPALSLYPNPGTGKYALATENLTGKMKVSVYNMLGTQVAEFSVEDATLMTEFNISDQPAGVYMVKFQSDSFRKDLKVIKQ